MRFWLILPLLWLEVARAASGLPDFDATFSVSAFGMEIGTARHTLRCQARQCTFTGEARPEGMARLFTHEHLWEQSRFELGEHGPVWQSYTKKKFKDDRLVRTVTLMRTPKGILYQEGPHTFPLQDHLFDALSLPLALAWYSTHGQPATPLYLQDNNWQDRLTFSAINRPEQLERSAFEDQNTRYWEADSPHAHVRIWLLSEAYHLPYRIEVRNKEQKRTIILQLKGHYRFHHASQ